MVMRPGVKIVTVFSLSLFLSLSLSLSLWIGLCVCANGLDPGLRSIRSICQPCPREFTLHSPSTRPPPTRPVRVLCFTDIFCQICQKSTTADCYPRVSLPHLSPLSLRSQEKCSDQLNSAVFYMNDSRDSIEFKFHSKIFLSAVFIYEFDL